MVCSGDVDFLAWRGDERAAIYEAMITFRTGVPIACSSLAIVRKEIREPIRDLTQDWQRVCKVARTEGEIRGDREGARRAAELVENSVTPSRRLLVRLYFNRRLHPRNQRDGNRIGEPWNNSLGDTSSLLCKSASATTVPALRYNKQYFRRITPGLWHSVSSP